MSTEIKDLINDALAELDALPADVTREVARRFIGLSVIALSGQPVAFGIDPRETPALHRLWRALPGWARYSLMAAALAAAPVVNGALEAAGADLYKALRHAISSVPTSEERAANEREPTPAPPLPTLVTPDDASDVNACESPAPATGDVQASEPRPAQPGEEERNRPRSG